MTMICKICNHNDRLEIDRDLVKGKSLSTIARKYSVSTDSLRNHKNKHLSRQLVQAWDTKLNAEGSSLLEDITELIDKTKGILDIAEAKEQLGTSLQAIREIRESYKLLSQIAFSLAQAKQDELIIAQMERKELDEAEAKQRLDSMREKLTDREFDLYLFLTMKINGDPKFQKELDIENNLPIDSNLAPFLAFEDWSRSINTLCEEDHFIWCRENGVVYDGPFRPKKKRAKTKPMKARNTVTKAKLVQ